MRARTSLLVVATVVLLSSCTGSNGGPASCIPSLQEHLPIPQASPDDDCTVLLQNGSMSARYEFPSQTSEAPTTCTSVTGPKVAGCGRNGATLFIGATRAEVDALIAYLNLTTIGDYAYTCTITCGVATTIQTNSVEHMCEYHY